MKKSKNKLTLPRLFMVIVLFITGIIHFMYHGFEELKPVDLVLSLVLLVALLGLIILELVRF